MLIIHTHPIQRPSPGVLAKAAAPALRPWWLRLTKMGDRKSQAQRRLSLRVVASSISSGRHGSAFFLSRQQFGTQELYCSSGTSDTGNQSPSNKRCSGSISVRQNEAVEKSVSAKATLSIATGTVVKSSTCNVLPIWRANDRTKSFVGGGGRIFLQRILAFPCYASIHGL
jgi:hypothetical protein